MKKFLITLFIVFLSNLFAFSQIERTYHWYFGDKAGLDFSSGEPVVDNNGQMSVYSGCSSMSDRQGNLLMYTDGKSVWNRNHEIMPNGTGLGMPTSTPAQSSIIIPMPGNEDNIYYIFHLTAFDWKDGKQLHGLKYSIVDMDLDSGLGDVTIKNEMLLEPVSEALGATMHDNCKDVWIVCHHRGTNDFYAFLLTENGVMPPVITNIGNFKDTPYGAFYLKISPNGKKIATSAFWNYSSTHIQDTLHLFDFDKSTGVLSNTIRIPDTAIVAFGFSPDNTKLYVSQGEEDSWLYQYNIASDNQLNILASKTTLYYDEYWVHSDFQIGNGLVLVAAKAFLPFVSVIKNPDNEGTACNLIDTAIGLQGRYCMTALPEFISSYFDNGNNSCWAADTVDSEDNDAVFIPNVFSPNADGNNDVFFIRSTETEDIDLIIFNRWGEQIFESRDINKGWDGTFKGKPLDPGVYVYILEATLKSGNSITKSGSITLIR